MQLAAYYISNYEFGLKNHTINFGGKYFYHLTRNTKKQIVIKRELNQKYIPKFYSDKNLTLVSAIVGRNGTGKTSLLIDIIQCISGDRNSSNILVFESDEKVLLFFGNVDEEKGISGNIHQEIAPTKEFIVEVLNKNVGSIYYSPHLDHKDGMAGIDISFDNIIYQDLEEEQNLTRFTNSLNPIKQHEFNNFKRQYAFINSDISKKLYEIFSLPKPEEKLKLTFSLIEKVFTDSGYTRFLFDNMPTDLRQALNDILKKCDAESNSNRKGGDINYQKQRLKHYILWGILSTIVSVGERRNTYLEEGKLPKNYFDIVSGLDAVETFYYFINEHYYIKPRHSQNKNYKLDPNPIPRKETENLIKKLFSIIDSLNARNERHTENFDWAHKCIYPTIEDVSEVIELETIFKEKLRRYYQLAYQSKESLTEVIPFIHIEWHDRRPSSGENAILNLFSRFHTVKNEITSSPINYYLIFLDEGDAGFHPEWKKKYIEIITTIFPYLFTEGVEFQIIFTTHDPLTLSDIFNYNILYFGGKAEDNHTILENEVNPLKSFAVNISELLSDSFFMDKGLIGTFAKRKIEEAIKWLRDQNDKTQSDYYKKLIMNIDEPIVQRKLSEMYDEKMLTNIQREIIDGQIDQLKKLREKII